MILSTSPNRSARKWSPAVAMFRARRSRSTFERSFVWLGSSSGEGTFWFRRRGCAASDFLSTRRQTSSCHFGGGEASSLGGRGPPWSMLALCAPRRATPPQRDPRAFSPKWRSGFSTPCPGRWLFPPRSFDVLRRSRFWLSLRERGGPLRLPFLFPCGCLWSLRPGLRGRPLRLFTEDHGTG